MMDTESPADGRRERDMALVEIRRAGRRAGLCLQALIPHLTERNPPFERIQTLLAQKRVAVGKGDRRIVTEDKVRKKLFIPPPEICMDQSGAVIELIPI